MVTITVNTATGITITATITILIIGRSIGNMMVKSKVRIPFATNLESTADGMPNLVPFQIG
jgi:hypothetical protein